MTRYRSSVLQLINDSRDHLTAEQIYTKMKQLYPAIVQATVYNNLNKLTEDGEIIRLKVDGGPDHYDRKIRHDHLVCTECGMISDITLPDLSSMIMEETGCEEFSYDLQVKWICPECRKKKGGN